MMKLFTLPNRVTQPRIPLTHIRVSVAHLTGPGKLGASNGGLIFETAGSKQVRLDTDGLSDILANGEVTLTCGAMQIIDQNKIALTWLSTNGCDVHGRFTHDHSDRCLTRLLQFQAWEDERWQLMTAKHIVRSKVESVHSAMRHYQRQGRAIEKGLLDKISECALRCGEAESVDQLRGIEGYASSLWFGCYSTLFRHNWKFTTRNRRPPKDPVNSLLSLFYMQILHRVVARIESKGYEVGLGALHEYRPGRASMACDIMEPLRVPAVDRWVMSICHQGIVKPADFETQESGAIFLAKTSIGKVLGRFEEHWHQGNFESIMEQQIKDWIVMMRENVSLTTSRAATYLKSRLLRESTNQGAGGTDLTSTK